MPFIIETFGAWGDRALKFVKDLRKAVLPGSSFDAREFYYLLCSEIAVAVQRGNARTIAYALQAARARDSSDIAPRWPRSVVQVGGSLIVAVTQRATCLVLRALRLLAALRRASCVWAIIIARDLGATFGCARVIQQDVKDHALNDLNANIGEFRTHASFENRCNGANKAA